MCAVVGTLGLPELAADWRSESAGARGADRAQMLPVCLGDWGDWCHGVLEPLKCRPSVNMTKARPALSPGADTVRAALTGAVESQIDTYSTALAACALTLCMAAHQPFPITAR
uniref:Uncharacterized protein n=1 Tax=Knipowitschia caucasica TaxID=637954 RepID=A0AAV2JLS1_KNICA